MQPPLKFIWLAHLARCDALVNVRSCLSHQQDHQHVLAVHVRDKSALIQYHHNHDKKYE